MFACADTMCNLPLNVICYSANARRSTIGSPKCGD
nr:MAG TPA: hypothetical protein [Caudoviricetes sp.]